MSTRCTINFCHDDGAVTAKIYRHCDGYPESEHGVLAALEQFFADVEAQTGGDTRFNDPAYLAAKFVVWQASQYAKTATPLNFLGLGILSDDPLDIDYSYRVECRDRNTRPSVTVTEAR